VAERDARKKTLKPVPQFIKVQGRTRTATARKTWNFFPQPLTAKPLDTGKLDRALTRLTGAAATTRWATGLPSKTGNKGCCPAGEKTVCASDAAAGVRVDGSESGDVNFTLGARLTFLDVAGFRSECGPIFSWQHVWNAERVVNKPFTAVSKWFFAPMRMPATRRSRFFQKTIRWRTTASTGQALGADLGYGFSRYSEIRAGYEVGYASGQLRLGQQAFSSVSGRVGDFRVHYLLDLTDTP